MLANRAHQPLRQHTIQRGDEIVRLHSHVEEAAEHVYHVIGVHGREDQMSRQRRLDGDLRGFRIANLAHHDLVGIVTQNRAQSASEGESLLLIDRNLGHAPDLVFHGVFDGDDLIFVGLDLVYGGVQRGSLAAACGTGNQHHAVGFGDVAAKLAQIVFVKANHVQDQVAELLAHGFFIEHAQYRVFAVNRWHDGNAEVDQTAVVLHAKASVLGDAALGDIEFAHDLHASNDS